MISKQILLLQLQLASLDGHEHTQIKAIEWMLPDYRVTVLTREGFGLSDRLDNTDLMAVFSGCGSRRSRCGQFGKPGRFRHCIEKGRRNPWRWRFRPAAGSFRRALRDRDVGRLPGAQRDHGAPKGQASCPGGRCPRAARFRIACAFVQALQFPTHQSSYGNERTPEPIDRAIRAAQGGSGHPALHAFAGLPRYHRFDPALQRTKSP